MYQMIMEYIPVLICLMPCVLMIGISANERYSVQYRTCFFNLTYNLKPGLRKLFVPYKSS